MRQPIHRALWLALLLAIPTPGAAQSDAEDQEARSLFQAGELAYRQGRFERALDYFQRAYELSARPELLFNIANLQERLNRPREALAGFERYLESAPNAENIAFAHGRIEALRTAVAGEAVELDSDPAAEPGPAVSEGPPIAAIAVLSVGGGLILAGVGTTVWWLERDDAIQQCNAITCLNPDAIVSERDAAAGLTIGLYAAGAVAVAVGAILLAMGEEGGSSSSGAWCAPAVGSTGGGVACAARF